MENLPLGEEIIKKYRKFDSQGLYLYAKALFDMNYTQKCYETVSRCIELEQNKKCYLLRIEVCKKLGMHAEANDDL